MEEFILKHRMCPVVIFNRSHYEDVLVVRVHNYVPKDVWKERYSMINDFERRLTASGTRVLKVFGDYYLFL